MQFTKETSNSNVIHEWEPGRIRIGTAWLDGDLIVAANDIVRDWRVASVTALSIDELRPAMAFSPTIILLGTGPRSALPNTELMAALAAKSIGLEIMSTPAACRTYNVLIHEQRNVVAALINSDSLSAS